MEIYNKILPIKKLLNVLANATGRVFKAYYDRKDIETKKLEIEKFAQAEANRIKVISKALSESSELLEDIEYHDDKLLISAKKTMPRDINISSEPPPSLIERSQERLNYQEAKRQLNIENIASNTFEELKKEDPITDQPLDEDWTTRFFDLAKDISNEEMQILWSKILAGEIKQPNSYSIRTLETLKNLNKSEAECLLKFGRFAIKSKDATFLLNFKNEKLLTEKYGLSYSERLLLEELGIITANDLDIKMSGQAEKDAHITYVIGKYCVIVTFPNGTQERHLQVLAFTKIGRELLNLIDTNTELDYIQLFAYKIRNGGVTVKYAEIVNVEGDNIICKDKFVDVPRN